MKQATEISRIAPPLLAWYHGHRRRLPFREAPTPYRIWVSEIMLQQTRMEAALPYYERFIAELPDAAALAACGEERLHKLWQGLGYYSRARNLQKAAKIVVQQYGGKLPADYGALLALPGIGPYTAGAIASIAFGLPELAVDGNVLRVFSRLLAFEQEVDSPAAKKTLAAAAAEAMPQNAPGDYNQALMELGALVCTPGKPLCAACPLAGLCRAREKGAEALLPRRAAKKEKRETPVCILLLRRGEEYLVRRRESGLLAGMWEPPLFEEKLTKAEARRRLQALLPGAVLGGPLPRSEHIFTHRVWKMYGWAGSVPPGALPGGWQAATGAELAARYALPSAFRAYLPTQADRKLLL